MKTFKEFAQSPVLYKLWNKDEYDPKKFGLPINVTKYVGEGAESFVFSTNNPNDPVYKIAKSMGSNDNKLIDRSDFVNAINKLESMKSIIIPDAYMHWGTYLNQDKPKQPDNAYYDKKTKSWTIDKEYPIKATNTTLLSGGIIKQDRINGEPIDAQLFQQIAKILSRNGYYVDKLGGRRNFLMTDTGELAFIDGISYMGTPNENV